MSYLQCLCIFCVEKLLQLISHSSLYRVLIYKIYASHDEKNKVKFDHNHAITIPVHILVIIHVRLTVKDKYRESERKENELRSFPALTHQEIWRLVSCCGRSRPCPE